MKSLWLKDRPWILAFAIVGAIGLSIANAEVGFLRLFVLAPHHLEVLFYSAGGAALLLGAVAVLWDDLLGTREFLMQRPISKKALFRARMLACGAVLASWMIVVPLVSWLLAAWSSGIYDVSFWAGLPEILSTLQIAWPMCAIGVLAAALPSPWWMRLVLATLLTLTVGMAIDLGTASAGGTASVRGFAFACWLSAGILFPLAAVLNAQQPDPDRPWSQRTRCMAGAVFVVSLAYAGGAGAREAQSHAIHSLHWEYPRIVKIDNAIQLAVRDDDWTKWAVADKDHVSTGVVKKRDDFERIEFANQRVPGLFQIEPPRFHRSRGQEARVSGGRVWVGHDGRAWLHDHDTGGVHQTGIGSELAAFPSCLRPSHVDDLGKIKDERVLQRSVIVVGDPESGGMWRFDEDRGHFVAWPLPGGDKFDDVSYRSVLEWRDSGGAATDLLAEAMALGEHVSHIRGVAHRYLIKDGELVQVDAPSNRDRSQPGAGAIVHGHDVLSFSVEVPPHDGLPKFEHDFEPRTWGEIGYAANAMALAMVRPPVTQIASHLFADDQSVPSIWQDRVICGGKRTWLLLGGVALSLGAALLIRRRLLRLGAPPAAGHFWFVAILVAGPVTVVLPLLLESARSHARPELSAPPAPRIVSAREAKEIRA